MGEVLGTLTEVYCKSNKTTLRVSAHKGWSQI